MDGDPVNRDDVPPDVRGKVVFGDDFHDLLHPIWRCDDRRLHLARAWKYRWKPELRRVVLCRIGRHRFTLTWERPPARDGSAYGSWNSLITCYDCGKKR